jgi:4-hydroxybenzoate polyprenyltransferase
VAGIIRKVSSYGRLVKFSHTIFAFPFAMAAFILASEEVKVKTASLFWLILALVSARTSAMSFNRIVDRAYDALNPRTSQRELPTQKVSLKEAIGLCIGSGCIFILASSFLNFTCLLLSPLVLGLILGYSYTKRFTWTTHFILGIMIAFAPLGTWIAVGGGINPTIIFLSLAVAMWVAGFDIIYACQDVEFDRVQGLYSIPSRFGLGVALIISSLVHFLAVISFILVGIVNENMGFIYWLGLGFIALILIYEHMIISPRDLSKIGKAFFNLNGYVSLGYFFIVLWEVWF